MTEDDFSHSLLPKLASQMNFDLLANDEGGVWIMHDRPLPDKLKWVDCDLPAATMTLVFEEGRVQPLGLPVPPNVAKRLLQVYEIIVLYIKDGHVADSAIVPLNVMDY